MSNGAKYYASEQDHRHTVSTTLACKMLGFFVTLYVIALFGLAAVHHIRQQSVSSLETTAFALSEGVLVADGPGTVKCC